MSVSDEEYNDLLEEENDNRSEADAVPSVDVDEAGEPLLVFESARGGEDPLFAPVLSAGIVFLTIGGGVRTGSGRFLDGLQKYINAASRISHCSSVFALSIKTALNPSILSGFDTSPVEITDNMMNDFGITATIVVAFVGDITRIKAALTHGVYETLEKGVSNETGMSFPTQTNLKQIATVVMSSIKGRSPSPRREATIANTDQREIGDIFDSCLDHMELPDDVMQLLKGYMLAEQRNSETDRILLDIVIQYLNAQPEEIQSALKGLPSAGLREKFKYNEHMIIAFAAMNGQIIAGGRSGGSSLFSLFQQPATCADKENDVISCISWGLFQKYNTTFGTSTASFQSISFNASPPPIVLDDEGRLTARSAAGLVGYPMYIHPDVANAIAAVKSVFASRGPCGNYSLIKAELYPLQPPQQNKLSARKKAEYNNRVISEESIRESALANAREFVSSFVPSSDFSFIPEDKLLYSLVGSLNSQTPMNNVSITILLVLITSLSSTMNDGRTVQRFYTLIGRAGSYKTAVFKVLESLFTISGVFSCSNIEAFVKASLATAVKFLGDFLGSHFLTLLDEGLAQLCASQNPKDVTACGIKGSLMSIATSPNVIPRNASHDEYMAPGCVATSGIFGGTPSAGTMLSELATRSVSISMNPSNRFPWDKEINEPTLDTMRVCIAIACKFWAYNMLPVFCPLSQLANLPPSSTQTQRAVMSDPYMTTLRSLMATFVTSGRLRASIESTVNDIHILGVIVSALVSTEFDEVRNALTFIDFSHSGTLYRYIAKMMITTLPPLSYFVNVFHLVGVPLRIPLDLPFRDEWIQLFQLHQQTSLDSTGPASTMRQVTLANISRLKAEQVGSSHVYKFQVSSVLKEEVMQYLIALQTTFRRMTFIVQPTRSPHDGISVILSIETAGPGNPQGIKIIDGRKWILPIFFATYADLFVPETDIAPFASPPHLSDIPIYVPEFMHNSVVAMTTSVLIPSAADSLKDLIGGNIVHPALPFYPAATMSLLSPPGIQYADYTTSVQDIAQNDNPNTHIPSPLIYNTIYKINSAPILDLSRDVTSLLAKEVVLSLIKIEDDVEYVLLKNVLMSDEKEEERQTIYFIQRELKRELSQARARYKASSRYKQTKPMFSLEKERPPAADMTALSRYIRYHSSSPSSSQRAAEPDPEHSPPVSPVALCVYSEDSGKSVKRRAISNSSSSRVISDD